MTAPRVLEVRDLGLVAYDEAWALQKETATRRIAGEIPDTLMVVQHPPVVTLGRSTKPGHLLVSAEWLESRGVQVREVERGGDITIHEPGQLVLYPIIDLKQHRQDLHWYLRQLEEVVIRALASFGLDAERRAGLTGVWLDGRKIASIGVHAKDWVVCHGIGFNVVNDLSTFAHVVPCGIDRVEMTTVARESVRGGRPVPSVAEVQQALVAAMGAVFGLSVVSRGDRGA